MKKSTQLIFIVLIFFFVGSNGCQKEITQEVPLSDAIITGYDIRACVCCGGLMITFDGGSKPYTGDFRLISNSAADLGITQTDTFPISVKVNWRADTTNFCNHILITNIERS